MYQPQPYYGYPDPRVYDNSLATVALVLSCTGLACCLTWPAGVIVGHVALAKIKKGEAGGRNLAIAALAVGYGFMGLCLILAVGIFARALYLSR